jgi:hypothetical protein
MSKTKEEILRHNAAVPKPQLEGVYSAMDEYAAQFLSEYKERLKAEIHAIKVATTNPDWIDAEVCMANKVLNIIDQAI